MPDDDLLDTLRVRLTTLQQLVDRYAQLDVLDLSAEDRASVARAIEYVEMALDQLW